MHWEAHAAGFAPGEFKRAYRIDLPTFYKLLGEIEESIETKNTKQAERSSSGPVASAVRLSMTLRYLAGGNVNDIYRMHGVSRDEMYKSVWVVVDAINNHPSFGMVFPIDDDERLAHIEAGFRAKSTNQLHRGCVGAIDGLFVKIRRPNYPTEDEHPARFFCGRKKAYGLNVKAVCDADRRFLDVDIRFPGASGSSLAHRCSELGGKLADGLLSSIYHLIGDAAYINSEHMLTPVSGTAAQINRILGRFVQLPPGGMMIRIYIIARIIARIIVRIIARIIAHVIARVTALVAARAIAMRMRGRCRSSLDASKE